jgi:Tfp pilus assembly protein PilO
MISTGNSSLNSYLEKLKVFKPILNNPKVRFFVLPVLAVLVVVLSTVFLIVPQVVRITKVQGEVKELETKINFFDSKVNLLSSIDSSEYKSELQISLIALPADHDIPSSLGELFSILSLTQLKLENISLSGLSGGADKSKSVPSYSIRMDISGSRENMEKFIETIKLAPRLVNLNTVNVTFLRNSSDVQASVDVLVFYKALPATVGDLSQKISPLDEKDRAILSRIKSNLQLIPAAQPEQPSQFGNKPDPFQ